MSESRYQTYFSCKVKSTVFKEREIKCKFDTGAEVTVLGLKALTDKEHYDYFKNRIETNGKRVEGINSYSGVLNDIYELPLKYLEVADDIFEDISVCVSINSEKSVIGMDIIGLFDFTYIPEKHCISYKKVREWERNPGIKYALARKIEEIDIFDKDGNPITDKDALIVNELYPDE